MDKTFETPGGVDLSVEVHSGLVVVTATETDRTSVSVEADTAGAEELVERAIVECRPSGSRHAVVVELPRVYGMRLLRRNAVTVRVEVPAGAQVTVATASADVEINGPVGEVDFKTASGDASIDDVAADVTMKSASGNMTIGKVGGGIRAYTVSGDLRCSSVAGAAVFSATSGNLELGAAGSRVEVKATSGDVRLGELAAGAEVKNVSGNVRVLAVGEGTLKVRSVSGDVAVGVVKGVELHVDVETASGMVHSDIPLTNAPGEGGARPGARVDLSVRSVSGNVEIGRALEHVA
ncbi:MAG TPA: DUF4097 family beta strand repeat-containing protein [Acidimicrobiales bacterium]|jgi:DUF4097 and DUF4098 domain-containing protein YvlB|nr:DUF4097 family beta strand repeat-containing protein [Acidimicrobiales bacterium]